MKSLATIAILLLFSGCANFNTRPHTEYEKRLLMHGAFAGALDAASTYAAVGSGRFSESNGNYADYGMEHNGGVLAVKVAIVCGAYMYGQFFPRQRVMAYKITAAANYGAFAWNTAQLIGE